jgi:RuvB-like protein 1 (pontin 52)
MYSFFRFAVQLLAPSAIAAKIAGRNNITVEDIKDIGELFLDAKSSAVMLEANADKYMK